MSTSILSVKNLRLALPDGGDRRYALDDLTFHLQERKILCIVGESGSGKSLCAQTVMGLLPKAIRVDGGEILFGGRDLLKADKEGLRGLRGRQIGMIFQEPMTALNPSMRIIDQIVEVFEAHGLLTQEERQAQAVKLATEVGLPDPARIIQSFPHQLSGGQRQRAMIAMALALEPVVLIADEPTTALDVTTQAQILKLIREIQQRRGMSVIFITHDFGVVADIADEVLVLQKGVVVEQGTSGDVLRRPRHDYTKALLAAVPSGIPPFRPGLGDKPVAISVANMRKTYVTGGSLFKPKRTVHAVKDVSFEIRRGETLGIIGESGSGKSTVARLVTRLVEPDGGKIMLGGEDFGALPAGSLREARKRIQMVFQDPFASLNPRRKVGLSIADGPIAHGVSKREALQQAADLLKLVGLDPRSIDRLPHEFSGGQRQRIGLARALALKPDVLIADESVSALDVTIQKQVLELLEELKGKLDLAMLFITHDLHVAAQVCDRIAVMRQGEIVELRPTKELLNDPQNAYTQLLLAAIPGKSGDIQHPVL
ncbi:peptide/nickel transport system ATP-binding protein [Neorhizobium galegae]|uniref:ABC transporter ATP-binding protein n=1 Tax=Neorhizobium galegae TaxID=399 RepID=UPI001AE8BE94|nr:ABC transporter ATP-binding protein [Neorhizobium galegae]MBP2551128.1 peptide/nickel transport system ATP-binding protein [Neorhizobium galegae]